MTQPTDEFLKRVQWNNFFDAIEEWIVAVIVDRQSDYVEDRVHKNKLRDELIDRLVAKEFDLS